VKEFWLTKDGSISKHKIRGAEIVAHGIIQPDQILKIYTNNKKIHYITYEEMKVGTHQAKTALMLPNDFIVKVDILTFGEDVNEGD